MTIFFSVSCSPFGLDVVQAMAGKTPLDGLYPADRFLLRGGHFHCHPRGADVRRRAVRHFNGISQRLIPGAVLAIDCAAILWHFAPNAVVWGFMWGTIGQLVPSAFWLASAHPFPDYSGLYPNVLLACDWRLCQRRSWRAASRSVW
jgi:PTS system ascorbate-specific IIC component